MEKALVNRGIEAADTKLETDPAAGELRRASIKMLLRSNDAVLQGTGGSPRRVDEDTQTNQMGDTAENLGGTSVINNAKTGRGLGPKGSQGTTIGQELKTV
eukprot:9069730-Heterocapsa_arctica.AAC.1